MTNPKIIFTGVDQASVVVGKITNSVDKLKLALGALGGAVAVGVFRGVVDDLDKLEESAQSAGVAVESLSALRHAAIQAGVGSEQLDEALKKLNVKLSEAAAGGKEARELFRALGISAVNSSGQILNTDEALAKIADKFELFRDGPKKAALAVEIFGRAGTKLIPLLNQGSAGLDRLKEEAERLGVVIGGETAKAAARFADQLDRLEASARGASVKIFTPLIEGANHLVEEFEAAQRASGSLLESLVFTTKYFNLTSDEVSTALRNVNQALADERKAIAESPDKAFIESRKGVVAQLEREKKALQEIQRLRVVEAAGNPYSNEGRGRARRDFDDPRDRPKEISEGQRVIAQLQQELAKTEELTRVQELQRAISEKRLTFDNKAQQGRALAIAASIDAEKAFDAAVKASEDSVKSANVAQVALNKERQEFIDEVTGRKAEAALQRRIQLLSQMKSGEVAASREEIGILEASIYGVTQGVNVELEKQVDLAEQLGLTISSSLGELITSGGKAGDIFKALLQDILKLIVQLTVLEPLAKELKNTFSELGKAGGDGGGASFGGIASSIIGDIMKFFAGGFANGGFIPPGHWGLVGERGPELAFGGRTGQTIASGGGGTVNVYIDGATDRASITRLVEIGVRRGNALLVDKQARGGSGL